MGNNESVPVEICGKPIQRDTDWLECLDTSWRSSISGRSVWVSPFDPACYILNVQADPSKCWPHMSTKGTYNTSLPSPPRKTCL